MTQVTGKENSCLIAKAQAIYDDINIDNASQCKCQQADQCRKPTAQQSTAGLKDSVNKRPGTSTRRPLQHNRV